MRYDTIFFDADGTLYDFDTSEAEALSETLINAGIEPTPAVIALYHEINLAQWKALERGETTREKLRVDRFCILFEEMARQGVPSNADPLTLCEYYVERLSEKCILIPGAEDVCRKLSKYASLYIITNGLTRVQTGRFSRSPISKYFKDVFISESMGATKPERAYFDMALERAGIKSEEEKHRVLVVGDSLTSDIAGGIGAGLDTCWYNPECHESGDVVPTYTIKKLDELYEICGVPKLEY